MPFYPDLVYFEDKTLNYPLGIELYDKFNEMNIPTIEVKTFNNDLLGDVTSPGFFPKAKRTMVVSIRKGMKLDVCKPSADYEFSIVSGCPGICEYCYLQTNQAMKPFTRVYVNLDDILNNNKKYIEERIPNETTFEVASLGDPIALEHLTGSVKKCIEFFANEKYGRLRVVTKFSNVDNLLDIKHNNRTKIRFSINSNYVIKNFEHKADPLEIRIEAAEKIYKAGYPLGFIIAPIMHYDGWLEEYTELLNLIKKHINDDSANLTFELIQYRFTLKSKKTIQERFPNTKLHLDENERLKKWGPFGNYKYVYQKEKQNELKEFFHDKINELFPNSHIEYFT